MGYFVQKLVNNSEGVSKWPIKKLLKEPPKDGGFGLSPGEAGSFNTNVGVGWYIKGLMGPITDSLPLFGYRRKSWLVISCVLTSLAWLWLFFSGASSLSVLSVAIATINIFVGLSDVVWDGYMVQSAQKVNEVRQLPPGTAERSFQSAQWNGAFCAYIIASVAGGVIANFFNLGIAAIISALLPLPLIFLVLTKMKEEKVAWDWKKAAIGFKAIGVVVVMALAFLGIQDLPEHYWLTPWAPFASSFLVIGSFLLLIRVPRALIAPIALIFCWRFIPFSTEAQYVYQYFTEYNEGFLTALKEDTVLMSTLKWLVVSLKIATYETIKEKGFAEFFFGSALGVSQMVASIFGIYLFARVWSRTPMSKVFLWCIAGVALTFMLYLAFPAFGVISPGFLLLCSVFDGFMSAIILIVLLTYAAERTPKENQASIFAFLMGMSNLGSMMGTETVGGKLFDHFGNVVSATTLSGEKVSIAGTPEDGIRFMIAISLCYLGLLYALVRWMTIKKYITHLSRDEVKD